MAFWGVEVKPGKPFTLKATEASRIRRLHLSQVTLGIGNATNRSILQCNVGNKSALFLCVLSPEKVDSCQLNLEFEEADEVIFSVFGPRSLHLTGYFLDRSTGLRPSDDESESYGEDIADTDMEKGSSDDYDYSDSFINDDDPYGRGSHISSTDYDEVSIKEMAAKLKDKQINGKGRRLKKKFHVSDLDSKGTLAGADDASNGETLKEITNTQKTMNKGQFDREDKSLRDIKLSPIKKGSEILPKEKSKSSFVINSDNEKGNKKLESHQNQKPAADEEIKSSSDATLSNKKRKRDRKEEITYVQKTIPECFERKKQAGDKNL